MDRRATWKAAALGLAVLSGAAAQCGLRNCGNLAPARNGSKLLEPSNVRIYVADVPAKYCEQVFVEKMATQWIYGCDWASVESLALPFGHVYGGDQELRNTDQFCSSGIFRHFMLTSPLRTYDLEEADIVFVCSRFSRCFPGDPDCESLMKAFLDDAPSFLPALGSKPHLMVTDQISVRYNALGVAADPRWREFTSLTIEPHSPWIPYYAPGEEEAWNGHLVTVPYPIHQHWLRGGGNWTAPFDRWDATAHKTLLASQVVGKRMSNPWRARLRQDCADRPDLCSQMELTSFDEAELMRYSNLMRSAWYCFQPPGDSPSRAGVFSCIMSGAIPVLLLPYSLDMLPFGDVIDWSQLVVVLPTNGNNDGATEPFPGRNLVDLLQEQHHPHSAARMLEAAWRVRHVLQYSLNPLQELVRLDERGVVDPEDDALTFSLKRAVASMCDRGLLPARRCNGGTARVSHSRMAR